MRTEQDKREYNSGYKSGFEHGVAVYAERLEEKQERISELVWEVDQLRLQLKDARWAKPRWSDGS